VAWKTMDVREQRIHFVVMARSCRAGYPPLNFPCRPESTADEPVSNLKSESNYPLLTTNAEFFDPNAMQLHNACSTCALRPACGM
jgi:hypothetical protein